MRLPRDLGGAELARALEKLGYRVTRQTGSHMRLTTADGGEHHLTILAHSPLRVGTLATALDRGLTTRDGIRCVAARCPHHPGGPRLLSLIER